MSPGGSVTAEELVRALARRKATLPAEIGTFIVLEACESLLESGPRELSELGQVRISEQGSASLSGPACGDERGARGLHHALVSLLRAAGPVLPPALLQLVEAGPRGGEFSLRALRDELEAALVPLNRQASRRVLARFAREAALSALEPDDVDAALNSLLGTAEPPANDTDAPGRVRRSGLEPRPAAPDRPRESAASSDRGREAAARAAGLAAPRSDPLNEAALSAGLEPASSDRLAEPSPGPARSTPAPEWAKERRSPSPRPSFAPAPPERESLGLRVRAEQLAEADATPSGFGKLLVGFALIALAVAGVALAIGVRSRAPLQSAREQPSPGARSAAQPALTGGALTVRVSQPNAQILRYLGRAPLTVEGLSLGVAHEFVATAEGFVPARGLVAADADWEATAEGARYELALQLQETGANPARAELELGPSRLASKSFARSSRLGSVRVVANPRGARVYELLGFSPELEVPDLPLAGPLELLIYREGYAPVVRVIAPADFVPQGERRAAALSVELVQR